MMTSRLNFELDFRGRPLGTIENLSLLLEHEKIDVSYNEIMKTLNHNMPEKNFSRDNEVEAILANILSLCSRYGLPQQNISSYLIALADKNRINPVKNWVISKPWDEKERISELAECLICDHPLKGLLLRKWLVSAIAAISEDGFSTRGVLTIQGEQGIGKSEFFKRLVPANQGFFLEGHLLNPADKDSVLSAISHWIVEIGELDGTLRKADAARLKAFISKASDKIRRPYAKSESDYPRRTVFSATVNELRFLRDVTGNSRFWVLQCDEIRYDHCINIQMIWAEAYHYYMKGESWHLSKTEQSIVDACNRSFEQMDPVKESILATFDFSENAEVEMTSTAVLISCGFSASAINREKATRAGQVLAELTLQKPRHTRKGNVYLMPKLSK